MRGRVGGVVLTGGAGWSFEPLGLPPDLALAPFGGRHRFLDFSLAALENAGIASVCIVPGSSATPRAAVEAALAGRDPRRITLLPPCPPVRERLGRLARTLAACQAACERGPRPSLVVALAADHILRTDLSALLQAHDASRADLTLIGASLAAEPGAELALDTAPDGTLLAARQGDGGLGLFWTGGLIVRADAVAPLLEGAGRDDTMLEVARAGMRVVALDALAESSDIGPTYWHAPRTLEAWYEAQMALCSAAQGLGLFDPRWPIRTAAQPLPAARVTLDEVGHPGQALNVLMAEGAMIRGGAVIRSVLGHSVTVESGAEVEDSVLFDGARVRRGASVRRAIVGPGAVVEEGQHVGYGDEPAGASPLPSGLVLLPASNPVTRRAAAAH